MRASGGARGPCDDVQAVASEAPLGTCFAQINPEDVCLTLTSGGCNSLHLCIAGARKVISSGVCGRLLRGRVLRAVGLPPSVLMVQPCVEPG